MKETTTIEELENLFKDYLVFYNGEYQESFAKLTNQYCIPIITEVYKKSTNQLTEEQLLEKSKDIIYYIQEIGLEKKTNDPIKNTECILKFKDLLKEYFLTTDNDFEYIGQYDLTQAIFIIQQNMCDFKTGISNIQELKNEY